MTRRVFTTWLVLVFFACARSACAHPHPVRWVKHHKLLVVTSALLFAADSADVESTIRAERRCPSCTESSVFMGQHPSPGRLWSISMAEDAALCAFDWYALRPESDYKFEKPVGLGVMSGLIISHGVAAYHNTGISDSASGATLTGSAGHATAHPFAVDQLLSPRPVARNRP